MGPIKIILNPIAGRGYAGRSEPDLRRLLEAEGVDFDLVHTKGPGHATELAQEAISDGFEVVVAAGGDGTTHEVVNGLMEASSASASDATVSNGHLAGPLGVIPVGSGSDFANNVGVPSDLAGACQRLARGQMRVVDVCQVRVDGRSPLYFDNTVNIGFGGIVTLEAFKVKWARGMALYLPLVLKTIFLSEAPRVTVALGDQTLSLDAAMICVGNGAREGGGFFCTPDAQPDDGFFDVCIVREIGRLAMLGLVPRFINGSHVDYDAVTMTRGAHLLVTSPDNLIAHVDGEMLCTEAHSLEFSILPHRLKVWC